MKPTSSPLPLSVVQRLEEQRARIEKGAFTSSFGVGEFLLASAAGYQSLGQVMGATVFQIGTQWTSPLWRNGAALRPSVPANQANLPWRRRARTLTPAQLQAQKHGQEMEITTHTAAYAGARRTALSRLQAEAALLGATGVAGVKLSMKTSRGASKSRASSVEFIAIGTAVKSKESRRVETPWLSNLSGQELWQLQSAGYGPCGFVGGNCSFYQAASLNSAALLDGNFWFADQATHNFAAGKAKFGGLGSRFLNFELTEYSAAIYKARELAVTRLEDEARSCGAAGIVGLHLELDESAHITVPANAGIATPSISFSFLAIGTAIRRENRAASGATSSPASAEISANLNLK